MKKHILRKGFFICLTVVFLAMMFSCQQSTAVKKENLDKKEQTQQEKKGNLWPVIKPFETGYLQVSELHKIYFQLGGNRKGKPAIVLHGGPGIGCTPKYFRYFNPEKYFIILHDQRGCGKSTPYGELKENNTQRLVEDIEALRKHFQLGKILIFGGSWGSTLGLAYGETYPQNVSAMVLRGIFTATKKEIDHFYHGGTALFFPKNYDKLRKILDEPNNLNFPQQLLEKLQSQDPKIREKVARVWAWYELKNALLDFPDQAIDEFLKDKNPYVFSLLENHYMANNCFLEEGQLFNNVDKLKDIPIYLINGRYDVICPPRTAYKLHKKLPQSKLFIVEKAGHSASEKDIAKQLVLAVQELEDQ